MAVRYVGGEIREMEKLTTDVIQRRAWLRQREMRLKDQLRTGEIELAAFTLSEIISSARPGDINQTKADGMKNAIQNAIKALNVVRSAYNGSLVTQ